MTDAIAVAALVVVAVVASIALTARALRSRTPDAGSPELAGLIQAEFNRITEAVGRQSEDGRELRGRFDEFQRAVERLQVEAEKRGQAEEAWWSSIRRLEAVLAGGASRGRAGENLLHEALSLLPPGMVVPDFRVNGKVVEFALVLPDGSRLPLDSKWTAVRELEELEQAEDPDDRKSIGDEIEVQVAKRAREVACYIDPPHTTPFAVACVPDAAYQACKKAHGDAYQRGVVIVPYSSAVPTVLTLHLLATRFGGAGDTRAVLAEIATLISDMGNTLENKVVKATTMLSNGADELRTSLGRARGAVARGSVQASEGLSEEEAETRALQLVD